MKPVVKVERAGLKLAGELNTLEDGVCVHCLAFVVDHQAGGSVRGCTAHNTHVAQGQGECRFAGVSESLLGFQGAMRREACYST